LTAHKVALALKVCVAVALLEPARLVLSAAMPGHPGGSTFARHLWSATIHDPSGIIVPTVVVAATKTSLAVSVHLAITFSL